MCDVVDFEQARRQKSLDAALTGEPDLTAVLRWYRLADGDFAWVFEALSGIDRPALSDHVATPLMIEGLRELADRLEKDAD